MKKFDFLSNLLQRVSAMSGMRAETINYDGQPAGNRRANMTSVLRHCKASDVRVAQEWCESGVRVAREWCESGARVARERLQKSSARVAQGLRKSVRFAATILVLLWIGVGNVWGATYELYSGTITEGDYIIVYDGKAMKNSISSSRWTYESVTISSNKITNPTNEAKIVWHIAASGDYWTIYSNDASQYAVGTGTKNQGGMSASPTSNGEKWTVTGTSTYEFVNKRNADASVNKNLRGNGTNGFACYSTQTGGALSLYKKQSSTPTTIILSEAGSETTVSGTHYVGEEYTLPTTTDASCGTKVLVGWSTVTVSATDTKPASNFYAKGAIVTLGATNKFYAVFANVTSSSSTTTAFSKYSGALTTGDYVFTYGSYVMGNTISSNRCANGTFPTIVNDVISGTPAGSIVWTIGTSVVSGTTYYTLYNASTSKYLAKTSNNNQASLVTSVDDGARYSCSSNANSTTYDFVNKGNSRYLRNNTTNGWAMYSSSTGGALTLYKKGTVTTTVYDTTAYATTCCNPLGSVTGNIGTNTPTSVTLTWSDVSGAEKYQVKVPGSSSHNDWTDAVSGVSVTKSCGTAYTAYFRAIDTNGSHCSEGPESTLAIPAVSWTVTSTGITHATASPAIPSTTCSGFSTTISPAIGYALPADITVTNASKSWNSSTGALSISSVTGNVSITITPTCVSPVITADPADADYYVGDAPTALSVTATLASGTRTYLWKVSTNGGSTWSDAAGTNNTSSYSGASLSTASAGTLKFKCIVGNSEGGCSVESGVATITVAEPSSWKLKGSWDSWEEHTMIEDAGVASYSISLDADSRFEFGFDGGTFYKNNGTIITTTSGWVFNTTDNNCHIHTGPAGTYTFAINTSTKTVTVTYPTVSHPNEHYVYFKNTNVWGTVYGYLANSGNDNKAAAWPGSVMQPTTTICGETYHYAALNAMSGTYNTIVFNNGSDGYGNQTSDLSTTGSLGKYNANQDASWYQFKYAINFDKGTGSGDAMVSIENLCPGSDQALTANTYTKEHNTFAGWIADVDVKVGESTIDAGEIIDDEVTIKDIQSDINLTAQWTPNTYTITKTLTNVANVGLPASFTYTGATTTALNSTFTVDADNFFLPSSIAVTMGGTPLTSGTDYTYNSSTGAFTFSAIISGDIVITASATAKLKSIAITTQPTTRKYFAGESFSSTGAVVTATMGDGSTKTVSATWTPSGALSAGTSQTVTASYSEGGIDQTATTTIDVYSVTVNKKNEDGDAIDVAGVTVSWTVGSKALAAGVGSTKYAFKQWEVIGASIGSTTSASTTLSSPTANVVVNAVFYKPRVIKWSVNGDDSYETGSPTTTVAYNGTISTVPTNPSGLVCASTFVAWTDAAHNNGTTAKDDASYYGSALYTAAGDFPNITAETTTFYAVFAEGGGAAVNTVMWGETWTDATVSNGSSGQSDANPDDNCSTTKGTTIYGAASISYTQSDNSNVYCRNENSAGGTAPELYIKSSKSWTISGIPTGGAATLSLTYATNKTPTVTVSTTELGKTPTISGANKDKTITTDGASTITIQFSTSENTRVDNVELRVATVSLTNYVTQCDANIVSVTYDANGGATSCTNTTTDKTEDYTVCSTPPTRDYYTFAGWLCSVDSKTYAASATIDDAVIDADFTLTAQWTPVTYNITYELDGGTNNVGNPATYNVTTATITLQDPTKGHDRFDGWYKTYSAGVYSDPVTSIPLGSHGDITLYAKWAARHEIIFDADGATTTIYRAEDEDLSASVAGQGSVPSDPSAPTACSSKVFVGWSESTIDGETDTEPGDLMKPAAGTVNEDKHYYAVWANESSESGTVTVFSDAFQSVSNGSDYQDYKAKPDKYTTNKVYGTGSAGEARMSSSSASGSISIDLSGEDLESTITVSFKLKYWSDSESGYVSLSCMDDGNTASFSNSPFAYPTTSGWKDFSSTVTNVDDKVESITFNSTSGKRVYIKDIVITQTGTVYTYSAYSTSCCATNVTLTQNSPEHGTITFGKATVPTCGGDQNVSLTITPAAGYQLSSYEVATGSGKVAAKSVSPIALNNNSSAAQNITLTFAEDANGAYDVTAAFSLMTVTGWTWTLNSEAIPNPLNLYVGQSARLDVAYTPAGVDASKKTYTRTKVDAYINWSGAAQATYSTISGKASTGESTTAVTFTHADGPTTTVNVKVLPLPLVHFTDNVHNVVFADVAGTIEDNAMVKDKTTPTTSDFSGTTYNTCEEQHEHLVGWIESGWADEHPNATHSEIAGAGADVFYTAGASIDVEAQNGKTFYAVWSKIE